MSDQTNAKKAVPKNEPDASKSNATKDPPTDQPGQNITANQASNVQAEPVTMAVPPADHSLFGEKPDEQKTDNIKAAEPPSQSARREQQASHGNRVVQREMPPSFVYANPADLPERDYKVQLLKGAAENFDAIAQQFVDGDDDLRTFIAFKATAGGTVARSAQIGLVRHSAALTDMVGIYKEIRATGQLREKNNEDATELTNLGATLRHLHLALATEEETPRANFVRIEVAATSLMQGFHQIQQASAPWSNYLLPEALTKASAGIGELQKWSEMIGSAAHRAAESCDSDEIQDRHAEIGQALQAMHSGYANVICELDHLASAPELEPPLLLNFRMGLNHTGYFMADMVNAYQQIQLVAANPVAQLRDNWQAIARFVQKLQQEHERWARSQLCPPLNFCKESIRQLESTTHQAIQLSESLVTEPMHSGKYPHFVELAAKAHRDCVTIYSQVANVAGYRWHIFDEVWLPLAQVQLGLAGCTPQADESTNVKGQLATFFRLLGLLHKAADEGEASHTHRAPISLQRALPGLGAGVRANSSTAIPVTVNSTRALEQWKKVEEIALSLQGSSALRQPGKLASIREQAQAEQQWLQSDFASNREIPTRVLAQTGRRLQDAEAALQSLYTVTQDNATGVEKKQLTAPGAQLAALHQQIAQIYHE